MKAPIQSRRRELSRLTEEITTRKGRVARDLYGIGLRLLRVRQEELWEVGRYRDFEDYLVRAVDISRRSAYRFMRVAEHFSAEIAGRYGVTKLDAALRYLSATMTDEQPGDLLAADIRVRDEQGRWLTVALHEASAVQIDEAARELEQNRRARKRRRIPASWRQRADRLEALLPEAPPGTSVKQRVRLRRASDGRLAVTFASIPVDELHTFLEVVANELEPSDG